MTMARPDDFHLLRERVVLAGTLTTRTALHIGGGAGELEAVDLPVVKTSTGLPFIPGSSLKGVVRSTVESLLRAAEIQGLSACDPFDDAKACGSPRNRGASMDSHCAVCRIFGSYGVASHVRFSDAHLVHPGGPSPLEKRDGVAIDRDLRVAADKRKYDVEVVAPGTAFALEILAQNLEPWQLGLLLAGLDPIEQGFTALGGFTSRGLGRVEIQWKALTRSTAKQMLFGSSADAPDLGTTFDAWRAALAAKTEEKG